MHGIKKCSVFLHQERKQYADTVTEGSFEEWEKQRAVYNVSTVIQKNALEAMDMVQLENEKLKEENKQLRKQLSKIIFLIAIWFPWKM